MSLSLDITKIMAEVHAQAKSRDEKLVGIEQLIDRYPGSWWRGGIGKNTDNLSDNDNAAFEYMSYTMSQLVWDNPSWKVTTRRPRAQQMVAEAMQWQMNRWAKDSDLTTVLEDLAVDFSFCWGVAHVSPQPLVESYEAEDPLLYPQVSRISQWDFGFDHRAPTWRRARMLWHRYKIDKEDLLEKARMDREKPRGKRENWNLKAIQELNTVSAGRGTGASGVDSIRGAGWLGGHDWTDTDRDEVEVLNVYLPGHRLDNKPGPEEGFNGTILTLGLSGNRSDDLKATELKPPQPFFGPRWGPYTVIGAYVVPDSAYPLSLLCATAGQIERARRISDAVDNQVKAYKRLMLVSALDPQLATTIRDGKNDNVYSTQSVALDGLAAEFEMGGTTPGNVAAKEMFRADRDRTMGFAENQRGVTTGDTATDTTFANEAAQGRQGFVRKRYQSGIRRVGLTAAWYFYHTDEIVSPLGLEAAEAFGVPEDEDIYFVGGHFQDGSGATFDDLGLEIEVESMSRPSEARRATQGQVLQQLIAMAPAFPTLAQMGADVKGIIDAYGERYGWPEMSKLFPGLESVDLASMQPGEVEPRFAKDVGLQGILKGFKAMAGGGGGGAERVNPGDFGGDNRGVGSQRARAGSSRAG